MQRRALITSAATLVTLAAAGIPAGAAGAAAPEARIAQGTQGAIDADVRSRSGRVLGHLHAHLTGSGRGSGTFRPVHGNERHAPLNVGLRGRRAGSATAVSARGEGLRLALRITRAETVSGRGTLEGARVTLRGAAGEEPPNLRRGMRMLVVGRPRGEGFTSLRRMFRMVRFNRRRHARHRFLRERDEFHSYAALVFGPDVDADDIAAHRLLRAFYGAGKWIAIAPAGESAEDALRAVHAHVPARPTPAFLIRSVGPRGSHHTVKPTLSYPQIVVGREVSRRQRRLAQNRRIRWFLGELRRLGRAHMSSAGDSAGARAAQGGTNPFNLPANASAIEIAVPFYHEFSFSRTQNKANYQPCGWNQTSYNAWCPDTWYWKQISGGDTTAGCRNFLNNGYDIIDRRAVSRETSTTNSDGAYNITWDQVEPGDFIQRSGQDNPSSSCPSDGAQTGNIQGNDYYYAIYNPVLRYHTIVVVTDPTVSASTNGVLWHDNQQNGGGAVMDINPLNGLLFPEGVTLPETAWFLGQYSHNIALTGLPALGQTNFEYSAQKSFPTRQITMTQGSNSESTSQGFSVGFFGDQGTLNLSETQTVSTSVSFNTPSWTVSPTSASRNVSYTWNTNDPISWGTITGGGGGPWGLNDLNKSAFSPATLTAWEGPEFCCQVNIASTRMLSFVDHFSMVSGGNVVDRFAVSHLQYGDSPNEIVPYTPNPAGPGIDLCDSNVTAPDFKSTCSGQQPAPTIAMVGTCGGVSAAGQFSFGLNGSAVGGNPPTAGGQPLSTYTCPGQLSVPPIEVDPGTPATMTVSIPPGITINTYMGCFVGDADTPVVTSQVLRSVSVPRITVPASALARGNSITCTVFHKNPG